MDLYPWVVFVHAATVLLFFIAHGTSMAVAFKLKGEAEPARVRALLELSRYSLGVPTIVVVLIGLVSGIAAGFMGSWWGQLWIWISLVLFVGIGLAMTPLVAFGSTRSGSPRASRPRRRRRMRRYRWRIPRSCVASSMPGIPSRSRSSGSPAFSRSST